MSASANAGGGYTYGLYVAPLSNQSSLVPVHVKALLTANSDSSSPQFSVAYAGVDINALGAGDLEHSYFIQTDASNFAQGYQVDLVLNVIPNHIIYVSENVISNVNSGDYNGGNYGHFASAFADPYFYIDPSFADANQYQLIFSDGVANSPISAPSPGPGVGLLSLAFIVLAAGWSKLQSLFAR